MSNRAHRTKSRVQERRALEKANAARRRRLIRGGAIVAALLLVVVVFVAISGGGDDTAGDGSEIAFNGVALPAFTGSGADPAVGLKAPLFVTQDLEGNRQVVGGGGGPNDTAKLVVFVAHWCPTCQREVPELAQWFAENEVPAGVEVVAVSTFEDPERGNYPPDVWLESAGWPYPVMADSSSGEIAAAFGMSRVPAWVVLDDTNVVLMRGTGPIEGSALGGLLNMAAQGA